MTCINFYMSVVRIFCASDFLFVYPYSSGEEYRLCLKREVWLIQRLAKGAELMALNLNRSPPAV